MALMVLQKNFKLLAYRFLSPQKFFFNDARLWLSKNIFDNNFLTIFVYDVNSPGFDTPDPLK